LLRGKEKMESNKDEADRCFGIAQEYELKYEYHQSLKFYTKSNRLYPNERSQKKIVEVELKIESMTSESTRNGPKYTDSTQFERNENTPSPEITQKHKDIVDRIKKSKTFYDILGVQKDASPEEIKKQYRKVGTVYNTLAHVYQLSVQLHPDKNKTPGAEDAFKKLGQAFGCLSDSNKRRLYDETGAEEPSFARRSAYETELSPEEIFSMFFGPGMELSFFRK
jgi:hypothetical protein